MDFLSVILALVVIIVGLLLLQKWSKERDEGSFEIDPKGPLSSREVKAVKDTWALVEKDIKPHSVQFFLHFFKMYPQYHSHFAGFKDTPFSDLPKSRAFKAHGYTVFNAIGGLIKNIEDPEMLVELLVKTGESHKDRGLKLKDFQNLNEAMLSYLASAFGKGFDPLVASGWRKTLDLVAQKINEGLLS